MILVIIGVVIRNMIVTRFLFFSYPLNHFTYNMLNFFYFKINYNNQKTFIFIAILKIMSSAIH